MKRNIEITAFCMMVIFLNPISAFAQTADCPVNYERASLLYNSGMPDSALSIIKPCLENKKALNNISKETRGRIFRLAALSNIMTGSPADAERYARKMLTCLPDYKNKMADEDLLEFRLMLNKLVPQPSLRFGITGGTNLPVLKLQKEYSNYNLDSLKSGLKKSFGFQFGIIGEKALSGNFSLEAGAGISQVIFEYSTSGVDLDFQNRQYIYDQKMIWVEIPVLARYYFKIKSFKPYLEAGINGRLLLNSMEKSDAFGRYWFTNSSNSNKILATFITDFENFGILAGGGISYDINKFSLRMDFRYNHYLRNSGISSKFDNVDEYDDIGPDERFHYTDDINLLNLKYFQMSIGFLYNFSYKVF